MKTILAFLILSCVIALPALAELTDSDLDKIRLILNDSEKRIKSEIKSDIAESEKRMKAYVDVRFESVEKRLTLLSNIVIALVVLIIVAVGLPQALMAWRNRETQQQIDSLKQEIEMLKQQKA